MGNPSPGHKMHDFTKSKSQHWSDSIFTMTEDHLGMFVVRSACRLVSVSTFEIAIAALLDQSILSRLCVLQNWLGLVIVALVLAYHFVVADPKFAQE